MKRLVLLIVIGLLLGCSSTRLVESWKNPQSTTFNPTKLLVVGMTEHINARTLFEQKLSTELTNRGFNTVKSLDIFSPDFTHAKKTEEDISTLVKMLREKGVDAVMVTAVKGIEKKKVVRRDYYNFYVRRHGFRDYYFINQDIYFYPQYYDIYKIYHVETSLYNINSDDERSLVWIGYIDIIDPSTITNTVDDYVKEIIASLEKEGVVKKL